MTDTLIATLQTNHGRVVVRLLPDHAPKTVRNFSELAEGGRDSSVTRLASVSFTTRPPFPRAAASRPVPTG